MTAREDIKNAILRTGVIAEIRGASAMAAAELTEAVLRAGIEVVEVSLIMPDSLNVIAHGRSLGLGHVGAGAVIDDTSAEVAMRVGAEFLAAYTFDPEMVQSADEGDVLVIAGVGTISEAAHAFDLGADFLKLFPASAYGPAAFHDVLDALPNMPFLASGGVTVENAADYIRAGCVAVGLGQALTEVTPAEAAVRARTVLDAVAAARQH